MPNTSKARRFAPHTSRQSLPDRRPTQRRPGKRFSDKMNLTSPHRPVRTRKHQRHQLQNRTEPRWHSTAAAAD